MPLIFLKVLVSLILNIDFAFASCNISVPCEVRSELADEIHMLRRYKSCQDAYNRDCVCQQPIDVLFNEAPPYIFTGNKHKTEGIIPGLLNIAVKTCCFSTNCTPINYLEPYTSSLEVLKRIPQVTIITPFVSKADTVTALGNTYVQLIKTRGVVYVAMKDMSYVYFSRFFRSVGSNWPLFCVSLLLALDAGIIVWLMDSSENRDEFPQRFRTGVIEGFWWAYVSMTTVGYGDKTPKTIAARAFGVIWITIGISLCGVFTASLTTGMTQSFLEDHLVLENQVIGVMNTTRYELNIAMREGAKTKVYKTFRELKHALKTEQVEAILLDELVWKYYLEELKETIGNLYMRRNAIKNSDTSYGMVFSYDKSHNKTNHRWSTFLSGFFQANQDNLDVMVELSMRNLPQNLYGAVSHDDEEGTTSIFHFQSVYQMLFKYVGYTTLVLMLIGLSSEKLRLMTRYAVASRQEKWFNKVSASDENRENERRQIALLNRQSIAVLQERFHLTMKEIQDENEHVDYARIERLVDEKVFEIGSETTTNSCLSKSQNNEIEMMEIETQ